MRVIYGAQSGGSVITRKLRYSASPSVSGAQLGLLPPKKTLKKIEFDLQRLVVAKPEVGLFHH